MPFGEKALNPDTPYHIYEYRFNARVFYVGISWSDIRSHGRWAHVCNLVRHQDAGTLRPSKAKELRTKSNQVIAALTRHGASGHEVVISWRGLGRASALRAETVRIRSLVESGCRLANDEKNDRPATLAEILDYLGVRPRAIGG